MKKLFWDDPYATECTAKVTNIEGNTVQVDQSIFFAFSGGQASDEGTIGGIQVKEALKEGDKEDIIDIKYGLTQEPNFEVGDEVEIKIDPDRRAKLRRLHSAAHILYYLVGDKLGKLKSIGSNIAPEKARMDFVYEMPLNDLIPELEQEMNKFLSEDHKIITQPDEKKEDLKWWACEKWRMPCGGTHARSTSEIGQVKLKRKNIGKGKERIEIYLTE